MLNNLAWYKIVFGYSERVEIVNVGGGSQVEMGQFAVLSYRMPVSEVPTQAFLLICNTCAPEKLPVLLYCARRGIWPLDYTELGQIIQTNATL